MEEDADASGPLKRCLDVLSGMGGSGYGHHDDTAAASSSVALRAWRQRQRQRHLSTDGGTGGCKYAATDGTNSRQSTLIVTWCDVTRSQHPTLLETDLDTTSTTSLRRLTSTPPQQPTLIDWLDIVNTLGAAF
jgi:hypothetical protein